MIPDLHRLLSGVRSGQRPLAPWEALQVALSMGGEALEVLYEIRDELRARRGSEAPNRAEPVADLRSGNVAALRVLIEASTDVEALRQALADEGAASAPRTRLIHYLRARLEDLGA